MKKIEPAAITAHGIRIESRKGSAAELCELLTFAAHIERSGLAPIVRAVTYAADTDGIAVAVIDIGQDTTTEQVAGVRRCALLSLTCWRDGPVRRSGRIKDCAADLLPLVMFYGVECFDRGEIEALVRFSNDHNALIEAYADDWELIGRIEQRIDLITRSLGAAMSPHEEAHATRH
jgi:hypothetical protein